ncbi:MAG: HutP family protein [Dethiobacteria bacterium]|nr:HutP family protein [Bacillota bacterium]MDW7729555.1 HutP family protein [Bacillota bacterium]
MPVESRDVAQAAISIAMTSTREAEMDMKQVHREEGIQSLAVDYGGEFLSSLQKVVERAVVASKREGLIDDSSHSDGAVAGATREALVQIMPKALGLNVGGKVGIARGGTHIAVAIFFGIGLLHRNDVAIGLGHRVV